MAASSPRGARKTVIRLRIALMECRPTIWRRLLVPGEIKLSKLHVIFQEAMGWENYHLHAFEIDKQRYGMPDPEWENDDIDEETVLLSDVISNRTRFFYEYDFGDSWRHEVVVESIEAAAPVLKHAVCLEGQRACPPEDSGGIWGYPAMLEAIADPKHEEHEQYLEWVGGSFDPDAFDLAAINAALQRIR